jgi:hypothetical protein
MTDLSTYLEGGDNWGLVLQRYGVDAANQVDLAAQSGSVDTLNATLSDIQRTAMFGTPVTNGNYAAGTATSVNGQTSANLGSTSTWTNFVNNMTASLDSIAKGTGSTLQMAVLLGVVVLVILAFNRYAPNK